MNRFYRVVFNRSLGVWQAVPETAKAQGKDGKPAKALAVMLLSLGAAQAAVAADVIWSGATDSNWATDTNWEGGVIPGVADNALITDNKSDLIISSNQAVKSVVIGAEAEPADVRLSVGAGAVTLSGELVINDGSTLRIGSAGDKGMLTVVDSRPDLADTRNITFSIEHGTFRPVGQAAKGLTYWTGSTLNVGTDGVYDLNGSKTDTASVMADSLAGSGHIRNDGTDKAFLDVGSGGGFFGGMIEDGTETTGLRLNHGLLILTGDNTYSGGTSITNSGTLQVGNGETGTIAGNVHIGGAGTLVFNRSNNYTFAGGISASGGGPTIDFVRNIGSGTLTLSGVISDTNTLQQAGTGTTIITGANSYTGPSEITAGTLVVGNAAALGTGIVKLQGGAELVLDADAAVVNNPLTIDKAGVAPATLSVSAGKSVTLDGELSITDGSKLYIGSASRNGTLEMVDQRPVVRNAKNATLSIEHGMLRPTGEAAKRLTYGNGSTLNVGADGVYDLNGSKTDTAWVMTDSLTGSGHIRNDGTDKTFLDVGSGGGLFDGVIEDGAGTTGLLLNHGHLILTGDNTYSGDSGITNSGTLQVGNGETGAIAGNVENAGAGTLLFNRSNDYAFTGNVSAYGGGPTVDFVRNIGSGTLTLSGIISDTNTLQQAGPGTTVLTGANTYTGGTIISGGTLIVNGSLHPSSLVEVHSGATLGGSGTVGTVTVANAGRVAPGNSIGTLNVAGNLTLDPGAILSFELGSPGTSGDPAAGKSDRIAVTGDLDFNATVNLAQSAGPADGAVGLGYYRLLTYGGDLIGNTAALGVTPVLTDADYELQAGMGRVDLFVSSVPPVPGPAPDPWPPGPSPDPEPDPGPDPVPGPTPDPVVAGDNMLQHWMGGSGTWNAVNAHWLNQGGNMPAVSGGHHLVFKDVGGLTGGTIAVEGAQSFEGLQFVDNGYRLAGTGQLVTDASTPAAGGEIRVLASSVEIATPITGTGGIRKTEAGKLILTGANTYTGGTAVAAGTLQVDGVLLNSDVAVLRGATLIANGKLGGSVNVQAGRLQGTGTVGSGTGTRLTVASGGTLAPGNSIDTSATGNSIGTLAVNGDLVFEPGSRFEVEVDPQSNHSDQVNVSGNATLNGGSVAHVGTGGDYALRSTYTILTASGTLAGKFGTVASDFAFLTPTLQYDYGSGAVHLALTRNDRAFGDDPAALSGLTPNEKVTAGSIDSIGWNAGHAVYDAVAQLPDDPGVIRAGFNALSGEIHSSAKTALIEDSRFVRNAANDRMRAAFAAAGADRALVQASGKGDVSTNQSGPVAWSRAFGSWGSTDADGNAATLDRDTSGLMLGADRSFGEWRIGVIAGYSHSKIKASDRASSAKSDSYHLGLYGARQWDNLALRTGAAHSWHKLDTRRNVSMPGLNERLSADNNARTFQAFAELGYGIETGGVRLEPFANLAYVRLHTDGYGEQGGAAALSGGSRTTESTFTTLGLRGEHSMTLGTVEATLRGMVGWRHALGTTTPKSVHAFSAGDAFTVAGVPLAQDSAVIEAGLDFGLTPDATLALSYAGQLSSSARDHGIRADLSIRF